MSQILSGVRILDFGRYISGPFCAALLADLGAEVIRVDKLGGSEDRLTAPVAPDGTGAPYLQHNRNKKSIALDQRKPAGKEIVQRLVASADVVVANFPVKTLVTMGIDYESLRKLRPNIILTMISTFGVKGPYADRVGFDGIAQVMSGSTFMGGPPEQPAKSFAAYADYGTAFLATAGTLAALLHRHKTGVGQIVEGTLFGTAMTLTNSVIAEQVLTKANRVGTLNRSPIVAPSDIFRTKDGWVHLQVIGQPLFERWCKLLCVPEWLEDPRFATDTTRSEHFAPLNARMSQWAATRTNAEVVAAMTLERIPCAPVLSPQQAFDDPHLHESGFWKEMDYPGLTQPMPIANFPISLSASPGEVRTRAPTVGEHTDDVLWSIGYGNDEIALLRKTKVI
jgi:crotonobetainyl-CoA:carnitine CoA-transferase CaiB-like acyl-CoA transferase